MQSASYNIAHSNTDRRTQVLIQIKLIRNVLLINKAFKPKTGYLKRSSFEMLLLAMKIIQCNKNIHSITYYSHTSHAIHLFISTSIDTIPEMSSAVPSSHVGSWSGVANFALTPSLAGSASGSISPVCGKITDIIPLL